MPTSGKSFNEAAPRWARRGCLRAPRSGWPNCFNEAAPRWARRGDEVVAIALAAQASMRPRHDGRGEFVGTAVAGQLHVYASMRPRHDGRGEFTRRLEEGRGTSLQ